MIEHEFDHVYIGVTDVEPVINKDEVANYAYRKIEYIQDDINKEPEVFTPWFRILMKDLPAQLSLV